ncbi:hypothetical protein [Flavobacterium sp.]|uniref:hypothetical protein n=1 Tax=Flavobacterium sp. TaxID=239 RepID=UPI0026193497|nr:hypothetical protein [Flavobacterium sp.]
MKKLSTENLNLLPSPIELKKICKSISALEAIICPDWEYRYYSYQSSWSETEEICEMRNGQGDHMLILFCEEGTCINGFANESEMNGWKSVSVEVKKTFVEKLFFLKKEPKTKLIQDMPNGLVDELPKLFDEFIFGEPVKSIGTTFCIWQTMTDTDWKTGKVDLPNDEYKDGSSHLLELLDGNPVSYKNWAEAYYQDNFKENELKLEMIEEVFSGTIITRDLVNKINPELNDFEKLKSDLEEIGYQYLL